MKYYEYLDLPNWKNVADKSLSYYYQHRSKYYENKTIPNFHFSEADPSDILEKIPEINDMLNTIGASVKDIWFFELEQHVDPDEFTHIDNTPYETRILMPLLNCENTETRYYVSSEPLISVAEDLSAEDRAKLDPDYILPKRAVPGSCRQVDSYYLDRGPVLMRPNEVHAVAVPDNQIYPRIAMLLMVKEDLVHLLD